LVSDDLFDGDGSDREATGSGDLHDGDGGDQEA
jgi:hypothetical protein